MNKSFFGAKNVNSDDIINIKNISTIDRFVHVLIFSQLDYFKSLSTCL